MLNAQDALELALTTFNSTVIEFVDLLNQAAEPSTWPATALLSAWGQAQAAVRTNELEERAALDPRSSEQLDRYNESIGFLYGIEEETRPALSRVLSAQFADDLASWRDYLSLVGAHGLGKQEDTGEDEYTPETVCGYRDTLEFTWRGVALAKIDDSGRLPGLDPDQMRREAASQDERLARLLGRLRPRDPLADADMWWHIEGRGPGRVRGRRS